MSGVSVRQDPASSQRESAVVGSMLWSAWADAVGFIAELTDEAGLRRRLGGQELTGPVAWKRRVGGKFGVEVKLPAGCYSDDTQLRLATGRAITSRGFDVEAFAKVELPVWTAYALGGGRATKAAASNMAKPSMPWFGNFFAGYLGAGGNGAAMRVQPHVWAAPDPTRDDDYLLDVLGNAVVTHGNPRALVGAVLHAVALGVAVGEGKVPQLDRWPDLLDRTRRAVALIDRSEQLASFWRPTWERQADVSLNTAWIETVDECGQMLDRLRPLVGEGNVLSYAEAHARHRAVIAALDLTNPSIRGSGTATVCASLAAAALLHADAPLAGLVPATTLGTDTDTIATMSAAIVGAAGDAPLPNVVQDKDYLEREAKRLAAISQGLDNEEFAYPDLLTWTPPRSQVEAVGVLNGRLALSGLALLHTADEDESVSSKGAEWSWVGTDFGQSMLVKKRREPHDLPEGQKPAPVRFVRQKTPIAKEVSSNVSTAASATRPNTRGAAPEADEPSLFDRQGTPVHGRQPVPSSTEGSSRGDERRVDVDVMLRWVWHRKLSDEALGYALRRLAESGSTEQLIAFTVAVRGMVRQKNGEHDG